ncbi:JAB domain-containing protein [Lysinibacillus xylanilyticus]|uniref:DNA repair protein RadC n=1 Tax=Lysinibacillus xylanilyticus TaxID=582475 RepID=A0ABT4EII7_9BACI|nr:JAB domain-containing protein [Lysinibacillus xylanilyticus]MCY9545474.1 DNA repair protein RadC [Lysinibacillus xylanilyticus]
MKQAIDFTPNIRSAKRVQIVQVKLVREKSLLYKERKIRSPHDAYTLMKEFIGDVDREHFVVLCLDTKNQPTCIQVVHIGSLNASIVHPREVLKSALLSNSASIIVGHNHPSDIATPSPEDIEVTERLKDAGKILGIDLLDHLIICTDSFTSLKEKGYV